MVDLENLKRIDKEAGLDVLQVWLFDLPELSYLRSVDIVKQQNDIRSVEEDKEKIERAVMLSVEGKSKEIREAETGKKLSESEAYEILSKRIKSMYEVLETLKAQRAYYDSMFSVVKNEVYFLKRMQEFKLSKEMKEDEAKRFEVRSES